MRCGGHVASCRCKSPTKSPKETRLNSVPNTSASSCVLVALMKWHALAYLHMSSSGSSWDENSTFRPVSLAASYILANAYPFFRRTSSLTA